MKTNRLLFSFIILIFFVGCSEEDDLLPTETQIPVTTLEPKNTDGPSDNVDPTAGKGSAENEKWRDTLDVDIYISGGSNNTPVYWKNGEAFPLTNGTPNEGASSLWVDGNDVYVSGLEWWDGSAVPRYWKNNEEVRLSDIPGEMGITSITVDNGNVYAAGFENRFEPVAKYWKNGQGVSLPCNTTNAWAHSIVVDNDDVYVAGHDGNTAKYWVNGEPHALPVGNMSAIAYSIVVYKGDIYIAGTEWNGVNNVAKYWRNGQEVILSSGSLNAVASSIVVVDDDVYVAGYQGDIPGSEGGKPAIIKYWKNGQEFSLTIGTYIPQFFVAHLHRAALGPLGTPKSKDMETQQTAVPQVMHWHRHAQAQLESTLRERSFIGQDLHDAPAPRSVEELCSQELQRVLGIHGLRGWLLRLPCASLF